MALTSRPVLQVLFSEALVVLVDDSRSFRSQFYLLAVATKFKICVVSFCLFTVSASDGNGSGGSGTVPGAILGPDMLPPQGTNICVPGKLLNTMSVRDS